MAKTSARENAPGKRSARELLEVAVHAARAGGEVLIQKLGRVRSIETKTSAMDLVTEADVESGRRVVAVIREVFPDDGLLVEEPAMLLDARGETTGDLGGVDAAAQPQTAPTPGALQGTSDVTWVIDPLDGTTSFVHTYPFFSVSVAARRELGDGNHELLAGVVYNPATDELFAASAGGGAMLGGEPIRVSKAPDIAHSLLGSGFPYDRGEPLAREIAILAEVMKTAHDVRRDGSAALDLCMVACGRTDGYWELSMKPWDLSAGALILREAGGRLTDLRGNEWQSPEPDVIASNGFIHDELIAAVARAESTLTR
jgi:myo-inositol-1(or 4)-monophosphatase